MATKNKPKGTRRELGFEYFLVNHPVLVSAMIVLLLGFGVEAWT